MALNKTKILFIGSITQGNMPVIYPFGHKILCDGYVIGAEDTYCNTLKIKGFLCDGYVMKLGSPIAKWLIINVFLFDGHLMDLEK
ncbi:hypothetical protein [Runella salmonicolor]|uniref:Uncharacterized protein n=1 Tax=Runella salmonicolor TaxID=2950278 RepID=A0ABT1FVX5_9BACT|nr:hypothetical protein [Runella salmonicolor]MCP1385807.1 hypothetical protein [Runella salmonicolor]